MFLWGGGMKHRFARWSNLSSCNIEVFTSASEAKELDNMNHKINIHLNEQSDVESQLDRPLVEEREEFFALSREEEKAV